MSKFKENALESVLYYLHRQGHLPQTAYAELLSITGEESMSLEEVVDFFGKIAHGTFGIKETDEDSKLHLTKQVDEVYDKIVENLDLTGRLSLLTTCKKLREESQSRELYIKTLTINFSPSYFQLLTDDGYKKTILLVNHSKNTNDYENWDESSPPFLDEIKTELRNVFQFDAIRIDSLNLMMERDAGSCQEYTMFKNVFENIQSVLSSRKVEVKSLTSNCPLAKVWHELVPTVGGLKYVSFLEERDISRHSIDPVKGLKDIERFISVQCMRETRMVLNFGHIPYCKIVLENAPTVEVLMELKEKLLLNPKLQQFKIISYQSQDVCTKLNEHFKTYVMPGANIPINQIFNYPGSRTDKLTFYATDQFFWFKGPCYTDDGEPDEEPDVY